MLVLPLWVLPNSQNTGIGARCRTSSRRNWNWSCWPLEKNCLILLNISQSVGCVAGRSHRNSFRGYFGDAQVHPKLPSLQDSEVNTVIIVNKMGGLQIERRLGRPPTGLPLTSVGHWDNSLSPFTRKKGERNCFSEPGGRHGRILPQRQA